MQKLGYPIFSQDTLPADEDILERLFGEEVRRGEIPHPMAITDVWKNSCSENTSRRLWAAKYVARHPNLAALELSSFKCGHDAAIYSVVEEIIESSGTPYFCFEDIDENKPAGSTRIRIETIAYFLARYREDLAARKGRPAAVAPAARLAGKIAVLESDPRVRAALKHGALPKIDVPLASLAAGAPPEDAVEQVAAATRSS